MRDFQWTSPTEFFFGRGAQDKIGSWAKREGISRALLVYGQGHAVKSGLIGQVRASFADAGIEVEELGGVRPNPKVELVYEGIAIAREKGCDLVVGIGGGSALDTAKAIAVGTLYEGDVWEIYEGPDPAPDAIVPALPIAAVLTIPAAGSEASNSSVLSCDEKGLKVGTHGDFIRPKAAFMNPELTLSLPAWQTFSGIADMCAHIMERYFSASEDVPVTDEISLGLLRSIRSEALVLLDDPDDYDARANIMWASTLAHNGLCGRGRVEDWASHGLQHALSAVKTEVTHGAGLAVIFPAWMRHVYLERPERFVQFGKGLFGLEPTGDDKADALAAIDALQAFFTSLGMPATLDEFGFVRADVDAIVDSLHRSKGDAFGSFKRLTMDDARAIYLSAFAE